MLVEIIWANSAVEDIARLKEFLAEKDQKAALRAAGSIKKSVSLLKEHPELGKPVTDMMESGNYRDLSVPFGQWGYVIRYLFKNKCVYILYIKHMREKSFRENK